MAELAYQKAVPTGTAVTFAAAAAGGDTFPLVSGGALLVRNDDTTDKTVTVVVPGTLYGQPLADIPVTVAVGGTVVIGPFSADMLDPVDGQIYVTYSAVTSVTVAAVKV